MKLNSFQKELLKGAVPSLVFVILFFTVYAFIPGQSYITLVSLLLSLGLGAKLLQDIRKKEKPVFKWYLKTAAFIIIITGVLGLATKFLGPYGILGTVAIVLAIVAYKLIKTRSLMLRGMRHIEEQIFGSSLDKNNWQQKKPKVVFTWKKQQRK